MLFYVPMKPISIPLLFALDYELWKRSGLFTEPSTQTVRAFFFLFCRLFFSPSVKTASFRRAPEWHSLIFRARFVILWKQLENNAWMCWWNPRNPIKGTYQSLFEDHRVEERLNKLLDQLLDILIDAIYILIIKKQNIILPGSETMRHELT